MTNTPIGRATGHSFRIVMEACLEASKGKHVFIIAINEQAIRHIRNTCLDVLQIIYDIKVKPKQIIFPGNSAGSIHFRRVDTMESNEVRYLESRYKTFREHF